MSTVWVSVVSLELQIQVIAAREEKGKYGYRWRVLPWIIPALLRESRAKQPEGRITESRFKPWGTAGVLWKGRISDVFTRQMRHLCKILGRSGAFFFFFFKKNLLGQDHDGAWLWGSGTDSCEEVSVTVIERPQGVPWDLKSIYSLADFTEYSWKNYLRVQFDPDLNKPANRSVSSWGALFWW